MDFLSRNAIRIRRIENLYLFKGIKGGVLMLYLLSITATFC